MSTNWNKIVGHYESCLEKHGDNHLGVDWPNERQALTRYKVMSEVTRTSTFSLLDYGCGLGHYFENYYIHGNIYYGYDKSEKFIEICKNKFPGISFSSSSYPAVDYVVMNGVFTEKREIVFAEFWEMVKEEIFTVWAKTNKGLAFNVMSSHVDWERNDLFHLPMDKMAEFVIKNLSRDFIIRNDYGLYEYTVYVYR